MTIAIDLSGQTAWVTGGAGGIGAAIVARLRQAGARVVSLDSAFATDLRPSSDDVLPMALNLRDSDAVNAVAQDLIERGWGPDVLVNNAGITRDGISWKLSDDDWNAVLDVNLGGAFRMARACSPFMRRRGGGAIINISSINGLRGKAGQANYAASKAGLIALTKTLARELGPTRIRVNAVAPGFIDTPMTRRLPPEVRERAEGETLLGRIGDPEDIASAVLFLASALASHITGQVLLVDGGQLV